MKPALPPSLISIVIPVYNTERYVKDCLCSVAMQSHKHIEVIIVDDGSTDKSAMVCQDFIKKNNLSNFHYYHKANGGLPSARNFGIDRCSADSDFVVFIDSDDEITPDCIKNLLRFGSHKVLSIGKLQHCHRGNKPKLNSNAETTTYRDIWHNFLFLSTLQNGVINSSCAKLYSLEIIRDHNLRFQNTVPEDTLFNLDYLQYCNSVAVLDMPEYYYYATDNSHSTAPNELIFTNYIRIQQQLYQRIDNQFHIFVEHFAYPQYRAATMKFIRSGDFAIPAKHLRNPLVRKAIAAYKPTSLGDRTAHFFLKHNMFRLLKLLCSNG